MRKRGTRCEKVGSDGNRRIGHFAFCHLCGSYPSDPIPQTLGSSLQSCCYEPNHQSICRLIARPSYSYACRSQVRQGLPDTSECFSSAGGIPDCAHVWTRERVGKECASGRRLDLETCGMQHQLSAPAIVHDPARRRFPIPVRIVLRLIGANNFVQLSTSHVGRW